mgnify:FL=1|jgi:hypothetical protein
MIDGPHKAWPQKDELLIERIDGLLSAAPVRRKNFFGTVAWFLESNDLIFAGAWGQGVMLRLGEERARSLIESGEAAVHDPTGRRPKREYVYLGKNRVQSDAVLLDWLARAREFVGTLPPVTKKPRKKTLRKSGDRQSGSSD